MTNQMPAMRVPDSISATGFGLSQLVSTLSGLAQFPSILLRCGRVGLSVIGRGLGRVK